MAKLSPAQQRPFWGFRPTTAEQEQIQAVIEEKNYSSISALIREAVMSYIADKDQLREEITALRRELDRLSKKVGK